MLSSLFIFKFKINVEIKRPQVSIAPLTFGKKIRTAIRSSSSLIWKAMKTKSNVLLGHMMVHCWDHVHETGVFGSGIVRFDSNNLNKMLEMQILFDLNPTEETMCVPLNK